MLDAVPTRKRAMISFTCAGLCGSVLIELSCYCGIVGPWFLFLYGFAWAPYIICIILCMPDAPPRVRALMTVERVEGAVAIGFVASLLASCMVSWSGVQEFQIGKMSTLSLWSFFILPIVLSTLCGLTMFILTRHVDIVAAIGYAFLAYFWNPIFWSKELLNADSHVVFYWGMTGWGAMFGLCTGQWLGTAAQGRATTISETSRTPDAGSKGIRQLGIFILCSVTGIIAYCYLSGV